MAEECSEGIQSAVSGPFHNLTKYMIFYGDHATPCLSGVSNFMQFLRLIHTFLQF